MTISNLLKHKALPFEIDDEKLKKLFSFFLHSAPTIDSETATQIEEDRLIQNWGNYIANFDSKKYRFLKPNCAIENYFEEYGVSSDSEIKRKTHGFVCKLRDTYEPEHTCFLRHIRNAIAHSHVYVINAGNRKFVLFEDFNDRTKKQTSRILLSQTDLQRLKNEILR